MVKMVMAITAITIVGAAGCKKAPSLEGTWGGSRMGNITFTGQNFKMEGKIPGVGLGEFSGTFTLEKDQLSLNATDVAISSPDPSKQGQVDERIAQVKPQMLKVFTDLNPVTITWVDDDHITWSNKNGRPEQLSRIEISAPSK